MWQSFRTKPLILCSILIVFVYTIFHFCRIANLNQSIALTNPNDYDDSLAMVEANNFVRDGFLKDLLISNRKGLMRLKYYLADNCTERGGENKGLNIYNIKGEPLKLDYTKDCLYTHYPNYSVLYWALLQKVGVVEAFSFKDFARWIYPWKVLQVLLVFLILFQLTKKIWPSLLGVFLFTFSRAFFLFQLELYLRPFHVTLFLLCTYLFLIKVKEKWFFGTVILAYLAGFDMSFGIFAISFLYLRRSKSNVKSLIIALAIPATIHILLLVKRGYVLGFDYMIQDYLHTFITRSTGEGYFKKIYVTYHNYIYHLFLQSPFLVSGLVSYLFLTFQRKKEKLRILLLCFLFCNILIFIFPTTMRIHSFFMFTYWHIFLIPALILGISEISFKERKGLIYCLPLVISLGFFGNQFKDIVDYFIKLDKKSKAHHIHDVVVYTKRGVNYEQNDLRKTVLYPRSYYLRPIEEQKFYLTNNIIPQLDKTFIPADGSILFESKYSYPFEEVTLYLKGVNDSRFGCIGRIWNGSEFVEVQVEKRHNGYILRPRGYDKFFEFHCFSDGMFHIERVSFQ